MGGDLKDRLPHLLEQGVIERIGRRRGVRFILSRKFRSFLGTPGSYTRDAGLDRETNKSLLAKHIGQSGPEGARFLELLGVLPHLSRNQVQGLLKEMKQEKRVRVVGATKAARWLTDDGGSIA